MLTESASFTLDKKSINNNVLFEEIHSYIADAISDIGILWSSEAHREAFVDIITDLMIELEEDGRLDQWNVISDMRNNTFALMDKGIYMLEIHYRQRNCLNTSKLIYTINDTLVKSLNDTLDYEL